MGGKEGKLKVGWWVGREERNRKKGRGYGALRKRKEEVMGEWKIGCPPQVIAVLPLVMYVIM